MAGFISLADAKAHLRVDSDDEDEYIQQLVDAASEWVENETGHVAVTREEAFSFDSFEPMLELRLRPVDPDTITVEYLDGNGDTQTVDTFRAIDRLGTTRVLPPIGASWPCASRTPGAVTVTASIGLDATDEGGAPGAPATIVHIVRLLVEHWYAQRSAVNIGNIVNEIPFTVASLLATNRLRRV